MKEKSRYACAKRARERGSRSTGVTYQREGKRSENEWRGIKGLWTGLKMLLNEKNKLGSYECVKGRKRRNAQTIKRQISHSGDRERPELVKKSGNLPVRKKTVCKHRRQRIDWGHTGVTEWSCSGVVACLFVPLLLLTGAPSLEVPTTPLEPTRRVAVHACPWSSTTVLSRPLAPVEVQTLKWAAPVPSPTNPRDPPNCKHKNAGWCKEAVVNGCRERSMNTPAKGDSYQELANSIDRSRKRHLEVGLLRGDQVTDRLRVQEASASPLLKRPRSTEKSPPEPSRSRSKMAMTMAEFKEYMEANTNRRLDGLDDKMTGMNGTISRIDATVKANSESIEKHEIQIANICAEVMKLKEPTPSMPVGISTAAAPANPLPVVPDQEYARARRSLRLWPVLGNTKNEIRDATGIFLGTNLGMGGTLNESSIEEISRVEIPSGPGVKFEVLVRFRDADTRDMVMGAAAKLAPFMDSNGRATAGMRMEVPQRLQQSFRILFRYGQGLRARHGAGTRRHVKFCDLDSSLYLNVKLPGDEAWSRISLDVATRGMRAKRSLDDGQLERRMDITGPVPPRQRAASTAGPPPPTQASAWMRRSGGSTSS